MGRMTWAQITQIEPRLLATEQDAKSAALHSKHNWFPEWISRCVALVDLVGGPRAKVELRTEEAHKATVAYLCGVYTAERARLRRSAARATR